MLSGIKILDLTRYFPGPFATLRLAERGAEVIKIESPNGDPARYMDSIGGLEGSIFRSMSRGKKCVSLDLKFDSERESFLELARKADVIIESFRPGVTKKLGIDFEAIKRINPGIVYVSLTGYGQNTSINHLAGHDLNYLALSGVMDQLLDGSGAPIKPQIALADLISAMAASEAVAVGLVKATREGSGVYIDVSMTDALISFMGLHVTNHSAGGGEHGLNDHGIGYGIFRTSDGRHMALCALEKKFFENFCRAVGKEHLIQSQMEEPAAGNKYYDELTELFASRSFAQWTEFAENVDCCLAPVLHTGELKDSRYVRERGLIERKWGLDYVSTTFPDGKDFLDFDKPYHELGEDNEIIVED